MKNQQRAIEVREYVPINGIDQFLYHRGTSSENPVMLYLHGGPGSAESLFTRAFQEKWEDIYTVVHWDQRGAGKTLARNPDRLPTIELMLQDLYGVIQYLKERYRRQKIVLLGHSWGSVLGSVFIRLHPEEVSYYIGAAQVVNMLENERVGYNRVREMIVRAGDKKSLRRLDAVGEYPGDRITFDKEFLNKCNRVRKLQGKYKVGLSIDFSIWVTALKSPIFEPSDIISFLKLYRANQNVYGFLGDFNLFAELRKYEMPVYYILGGNDWQAPYPIAEKYFDEIIAPKKNKFIIPHAGHMMMMEQPELFFCVLQKIREENREDKNVLI